jgi:hypothetical protein
MPAAALRTGHSGRNSTGSVPWHKVGRSEGDPFSVYRFNWGCFSQAEALAEVAQSRRGW